MEEAGALHGIDREGNLCLELGKEGEGDAEFSSVTPTGMEVGSFHDIDLGLPNTCRGALGGTPPAHCTTEPGRALPARTAVRDVPSLWLAPFPAELPEEISRALQGFGLQGCVLLTAGVD